LRTLNQDCTFSSRYYGDCWEPFPLPFQLELPGITFA
jgi:hypothetical protein